MASCWSAIGTCIFAKWILTGVAQAPWWSPECKGCLGNWCKGSIGTVHFRAASVPKPARTPDSELSAQLVILSVGTHSGMMAVSSRPRTRRSRQVVIPRSPAFAPKSPVRGALALNKVARRLRASPACGDRGIPLSF
jgi:hypothetical protein